jgi:predicted ATPase
MLTRLHIDNFKCFVGFEYKPGQRQLILGGNGSGKSSLMDALFLLRQFLVVGEKAEVLFTSSDRTRWVTPTQQRFALDAELDENSYSYELKLDRPDDWTKPQVVCEILRVNGAPIFEFIAGQVQLYGDELGKKAKYPFDWSRSALATISPTEEKDNHKLMRFKRSVENILCFRINPFAMNLRAEGEDASPEQSLSNFAAWHNYFDKKHPHEKELLDRSLRSALDAFDALVQENAGQEVNLLKARFTREARSVSIGFDELSDGQRNLISLYAILRFVVAKGGTVILDEPDNFISLREIQPWLMAVDDAIEDHGGQVLIISHHPELINQWAPNYGVRFVRDGMGPARVEKFHGDPDSLLPPAELIARGWDSE